MLLTVDIGNTSISLAVFSGNELCFISKLTTVKLKSADEYSALLMNTFSLHKLSMDEVTDAIILSVVPTLTHTVVKAVEYFGIKITVVGAGLKTGLNIRVESPANVGSDIICNCVGALESFSAPLIIVDLGTATTISVVNEARQFVGCAIAPGVKLCADALSSGCALLSDITLSTDPDLIGKNSTDSINSGIINGQAFMIDGFIKKISEEFSFENPGIIFCGGFAEMVSPLSNYSVKVMKNLSLYGLKKIFHLNNHANK